MSMDLYSRCEYTRNLWAAVSITFPKLRSGDYFGRRHSCHCHVCGMLGEEGVSKQDTEGNPLEMLDVIL